MDFPLSAEGTRHHVHQLIAQGPSCCVSLKVSVFLGLWGGPGQGEGGPFLSATSEMLMSSHPAAPGEGKGVPAPLMDMPTGAV